MDTLKIRGYACPEEYPGPNDAVRLQKALDAAEEADVRKVVLKRRYVLPQTVFISTQTELVLEEGAEIVLTDGAVITNRIAGEPEKNSWSFEDSLIYLKGTPGSKITGNLSFYHARYVVLDGVILDGGVLFEYCREVRMENVRIASTETPLWIARGCNNFILQHLSLTGGDSAILIDAGAAHKAAVIGKDPDIHELILKDSELNASAAIRMNATETDGIFNVQIDHIKTSGDGLVIGDGGNLPKERFFNITVTDIESERSAVVIQNETNHCLFGV